MAYSTAVFRTTGPARLSSLRAGWAEPFILVSGSVERVKRRGSTIRAGLGDPAGGRFFRRACHHASCSTISQRPRSSGFDMPGYPACRFRSKFPTRRCQSRFSTPALAMSPAWATEKCELRRATVINSRGRECTRNAARDKSVLLAAADRNCTSIRRFSVHRQQAYE